MNLSSNIFDEIKIETKDFLPMLYWCFVKFQIDPTSREGIGGRKDKIGGFIDRFSNQCVNWLIFNHILKPYDISVDPDFFFYNAKSAKKCADILGVRKDNKLYPFTLFNKDSWEHIDGMPFIEIKALRKSQNLAHLGTPQFSDDHYYCYVETDFDDLYLLKIFQEALYENKKLMYMDPGYIKDNSLNIIFNHFEELTEPKYIGTMKLINVINGNEIKKHFLECAEGVKPYYFDSFEQIDESAINSKMRKFPIDVKDGKILFNAESRSKHISFYIDKSDIKEIHNGSQIFAGNMKIYSEESFHINHIEIPQGYVKLNFKKFDRSRKETEYCNYKNALLYHENDLTFPKSSLCELINKIIQITE